MGNGSKLRSLVWAASSLAGLAGSLLVTEVALADPPGCTIPSPVIRDGGGGLLVGSGTARCATKQTRTLQIEIKWDKTFAPDPLTAKNADQGTKKAYKASVSTCDHGAKRKYYARSYFTVDVTHHDSDPKVIKSCM
jgi:hypothetical protein